MEITGVRVEGGEIVVWVQTPDAQMVLCGACGARARSEAAGRCGCADAPGAGGAGCEVRWRRRIWWCPRVGCEVRTWTEECELAGPRRVPGRRAALWAVGRLAAVEGTVASAARGLGVAWATVWSWVGGAARQVADDPERVGAVARLGLDETVTGSPGRLRRRRCVSAAVDAATGQVLDVFDGRDAAEVGRWLEQQPAGWLAAIEVVCCDPHEGCRSGIARARRDTHLSDSVNIAADAFGIVRLANQALDSARRRVHNDTTGHRGRKGDPLCQARKLLLTGAERLDAGRVGQDARSPRRSPTPQTRSASAGSPKNTSATSSAPTIPSTPDATSTKRSPGAHTPAPRPSSPPWPARCAAGTPKSEPPCAPAPATPAPKQPTHESTTSNDQHEASATLPTLRLLGPCRRDGSDPLDNWLFLMPFGRSVGSLPTAGRAPTGRADVT